MKRFLAIILAALMMLGLIACGQTDTPPQTSSSENEPIDNDGDVYDDDDDDDEDSNCGDESATESAGQDVGNVDSSKPNSGTDSSTGASLGGTTSTRPSVPSSTDSGAVNSSTTDSDTTDSSTTDSGTTDSNVTSSGTANSGTTDSSTSSSGTTTSSTVISSTTSSSTSGGTGTDRPLPAITPDRTNYTPTVVGNKEAIYYINDIIRHPLLTPYYNGYKAALTMTFDDGYDSNTGVIVSDLFERYGYRGTMMLGPCFLGTDQIVSEWNSIFARGYLDVGCHGYNHKEPTTMSESEFVHEIYDAIMFLRDKFPGQRVLTYATPFAHITTAYENYLSQYAIGNRLESGGSTVNFGEDLSYNPYRVKAISFNTNTGSDPAKTGVTNAVKYGRWVVELFHCVKESGASGVDVSASAFSYHCEWLYRNYRDDLWVATFEEVLIYGEQLKHTTVDYTACDRESMTVTVTPDGTLDPEIYNIPMSVQVYLPSFVDSAYASVNGVYQPLELEYIIETGEAYVIVRDIDATRVTDVVVYLGANKTMKNNCVHRYAKAETVEPTHETGGYTVNECSKCGHTYNSAYTNPVHEYTGDVVEVIAPTASKNGLSKHYCTQCDKYVVKDNQLVAGN